MTKNKTFQLLTIKKTANILKVQQGDLKDAGGKEDVLKTVRISLRRGIGGRRHRFEDV